MPRINEMLPSKFIKKEDVGIAGAIVTIRGVTLEEVGTDEAPEQKWTIWFWEFDKPMVLNKTNMVALEAITGSDDSEAWINWEVILFEDPSIMMKGEAKGGLRFRSAQAPVAPVARQRPQAQPPVSGGPPPGHPAHPAGAAAGGPPQAQRRPSTQPPPGTPIRHGPPGTPPGTVVRRPGPPADLPPPRREVAPTPAQAQAIADMANDLPWKDEFPNGSYVDPDTGEVLANPAPLEPGSQG